MLALALMIFVGPIVGVLFAFATGIQLWRHQNFLGPIIVLLSTFLSFLAVWAMRFDLGLNLPALSFLPSGGELEKTLTILAGLLAALLAVGFLRWPEAAKGRWTAAISFLTWLLVIAAGVALADVDFRH
ncbi:hypothetical protein [Shimia sp.]|uniref:hypothetical protein n=1 Tax=Shimia sp. TaxID=1954381 RepID=UPI0019F750B2|nr:hypothetical protein [Shimia sp.]MBE1292539.1 hypothetical protein [Paracoccaceae bacterium]